MPTPIIRGYFCAANYEATNQAALALLEPYGIERGALYVEKDAPGLERPELFRLLYDAEPGDVLLVDEVARLGRLNDTDWRHLQDLVANKELFIVALDVPATHDFLQGRAPGKPQAKMNAMLFQLLDAIPRREYAERAERAKAGRERAKDEGKYKGRLIDADLHARVRACLEAGMSLRKAATVCSCAKSTVQRIKEQMEQEQAPA